MTLKEMVMQDRTYKRMKRLEFTAFRINAEIFVKGMDFLPDEPRRKILAAYTLINQAHNELKPYWKKA